MHILLPVAIRPILEMQQSDQRVSRSPIAPLPFPLMSPPCPSSGIPCPNPIRSMSHLFLGASQVGKAVSQLLTVLQRAFKRPEHHPFCRWPCLAAITAPLDGDASLKTSFIGYIHVRWIRFAYPQTGDLGEGNWRGLAAIALQPLIDESGQSPPILFRVLLGCMGCTCSRGCRCTTCTFRRFIHSLDRCIICTCQSRRGGVLSPPQ